MKKIKIIEAGRLSKNEMKSLIGGGFSCIGIYGSASACPGTIGINTYTTYIPEGSSSSGGDSYCNFPRNYYAEVCGYHYLINGTHI